MQFSKVFTEWTNDIADRSERDIVAIDGKTVRGSFDNQNGKSAIPELLELLLLKGCIITIDAMGCQKHIAEKIIDKAEILHFRGY